LKHSSALCHSLSIFSSLSSHPLPHLPPVPLSGNITHLSTHTPREEADRQGERSEGGKRRKREGRERERGRGGRGEGVFLLAFVRQCRLGGGAGWCWWWVWVK